ncbi:hypothetical protein ACFPT7_18460 [Acidicapsa dinghuensis]|uniref:Uncharacterized protein n=1 Tax=Acidicapsa dinghuensis TaxID=2218256 RepID=A0ABW1ELY7_9BACT|nr:hypothetical protein [Acidicapsa dinghuensis]
MPSHSDAHDPKREPLGEEVDASLGYEGTDVKVTGIVVFLTALAIFVAVVGLLCVFIGKAINSGLARSDGPTTKWNHPVDVRSLGNMATSPELQKQFAQLASRFPSPRLQTDDGYQEVTDIHAKEDLLLDNYSWIDESRGTVRIPIERAMELIAERGLPVAPQTAEGPMLAHDVQPTVKAPLTNGFARTGYEQEQIEKQGLVQYEQAYH